MSHFASNNRSAASSNKIPSPNFIYWVLLVLVLVILGLLAATFYLPSLLVMEPAFPDKGDEQVEYPSLFTPADSVSDAAGNTYATVGIGQQIWLAENLRLSSATCANDRTLAFADGRETFEASYYDFQPRHGFYLNQPERYGGGALYNFPALDSCQLCPDGFRIPSRADWRTLINELGGFEKAGQHLMTTGKGFFNGTFSGRLDSYGSVLGGSRAFWWSDEREPQLLKPHVYVMEVWANSKVTVRFVPQAVRVYNSVRCVKDVE